ncbi:MAG: hypothetical protein DRP68_07390 [Candidatus Omnitrophota bacterium]|nr:MAG: hypothetical protein DRP68_07390 [Candidatus Omnitrophota bacterium]
MDINNKRVIEPEKLTVKLLNDSTIQIRPLTLAERKECIELLGKLDLEKANSEEFVPEYIKWQGDLIYYIITRSNKDFKREDVDKLLDSSLMAKIIEFTLSDPFKQLFIMR